ncbi:MAG: TetR/AcrR family transcriptional regulator [Hyphomonas sp.]|nr:TetR/AcrR family transcriptional regulator [Hyphomonas sp.]
MSRTTNETGSKARRRNSRGEETRRALIAACVACLNERGYAATSIDAVMARAGASRGSVLHQFPTRLALMAATIETAMQDMMADTRARYDAVPDPADKLRRMSQLYWESHQIPEATAVTEVLLAARWDPELARELRIISETIEVEIDEDVRRIAAEAGVRDIEACVVQSRLLILSLRGITLELMFDADRRMIRRALEEIHARHAARCETMLRA